MAKVTLESVVVSDEFLSLTKKSDRFDHLVDAGIKSAEAKAWLATNTATQREVDYPKLVTIFMAHPTDKKLACTTAQEQDVCSLKTAEHLWSAIKFAKEWSKQAGAE